MFAIISVSTLLVIFVVAEPTNINSRFSKEFQRVEVVPSQPIQYTPIGAHFLLLSRLQNVPQVVSGPPQKQFKSNEEEFEEKPRNTTEVATEITEKTKPEQPKSVKKQPQSGKLSEAKEEGIYYIYHPNGALQKVTYATNDDVQNMAFSARLMYENVQPIREPIYTYDPKTFVFKRV